MSIARRLQSVTAGVTLLLLFVSVSDSLSRDRRSKDLDSARRGPADGNSSLDGDRVPHATTPAEAYVLRQIAVGGAADLEEQFPKNADERVLGGPFLVDILTITSKLYRVHPHGIQISHAVVKEKLDLINREIPYDVKLLNCQFEHCIDFTWSRFHKSLNLDGSHFFGSTDFGQMNVNGDLSANWVEFREGVDRCDPTDSTEVDALVNLTGVKVGGDAYFCSAHFFQETDFSKVRVDGNLVADEVTFASKADFDNVQVMGDAFLRRATFDGPALFTDSRFTDLFLTDVNFNGLDQTEPTQLTGLRVDTALFDETRFNQRFRFEGMTCQSISPTTWAKLEPIISQAEFNPETYESLEALLRRHGFSDEANDVFIAKKRRERAGLWAGSKVGSYLLDWLFGYGRHLDRLLIWGLVFLGFGWIIFRKESGMQTKKAEEADRRKGKYSGFWYSLDLFVPIVALEQKDVWAPRDDRRAARFYARLHVIIGSLLIPIGLAALTGLIK